MKPFLVFFLILVGLTSCRKEGTVDLMVKNDPRLASSLRNSKESLTLAGNNLVLSTYLYRDFMPTIGGDGSKLIGVIRLEDAQGTRFSSSINLKRLYVIKGNEIWTANFSEVSVVNAHALEGVVRNGPFWGPKISVDVVCEFVMKGKEYQIIAKAQPINRID